MTDTLNQINLGANPNDHTGDGLRQAGQKLNAAIDAENKLISEESALLSLVPVLVANSTSAATANTVAIQTILSAGGVCNITQPGVFYINASLIYSGKTALILGANTTIKLAPNSNCPMLMSSSLIAFLNGGTTLNGGATVTLTQGSGCAVNVAWTAHGLTAGQGAWIAGATVSGYNGVFRVATVVDADNFTIYTNKYQTSAPAGTIKAVPAVRHFSLHGGTWDYDYANQTTGSTYQRHALFLDGLIDCAISDVRSNNAIKYQFHIMAVHNFRAQNLRVDNPNSDGVKLYGPATSVRIDGLAGISHDDFISLQTREPPAFATSQFSAGGDLYDVTVLNLDATALSAGVALHFYPNDTETMDLIEVSQGSGIVNNAPGIRFESPFSTGLMGRVTLRNLQFSPQASNQVSINGSTNCVVDSLVIEDCSTAPGSTLSGSGNTFLTLDGGFTVNELVINRLKSNGQPSNAGNVVLCYLNGATVRRLVARDWVIKGGTGTFYAVNAGNSANVIGDILFDGGDFDATIHSLVYFNAVVASGTPNVTIRGTKFAGARVVRFAATSVAGCHIRLQGNTFNASSSIVELNLTTTVRIASDGTNDFNSSTLINIVAGSPALTMYGNDLAYDAGLLATTKGQYLSHASAVSGRNSANQQGPCIGVDGTHFYALGTGASGVNTLIL